MFINMEASGLLLVLLGLLNWVGTLGQNTCPSTVPECFCRTKYLAKEYLICRNLHVDKLPPFLKDQNTIYAEVELNCDSTVSTLQKGAFVNITTDLLTLHSVSLRKLEKGAFDGLLGENLLSLDLEGNLLADIPEGAFLGLPKLQYLNLAYNKLSRITSEPFGELRQVTSLYLEHNEIREVDAKAFLRLGSVRTLDMSHNFLTKLPNGTFYGRSSLRYMYLNNNFISQLDLNIFFDLMNLVEINISYNNLTKVEIKTFDKLVALKKLDLSHNKISLNNFPDRENVPYLEIQSLSVLDISYNDITSLSKYYFKGLQSMEELNMRGNHLRDIPSKCFSDMAKLKILDLSWNQIETIQSDSFYYLNSLEILRLDHNRLVRIPDGIFSTLFALKNIYLGENNIESLGRQKFGASSTLRSLHLENNKISKITMDAFASLSSFDKLSQSLQVSGITFIDLTNNSITLIEDAAFFEYRLLETLKLGNNSIRMLNKTTLQGLPELKSLELQNNQLEQLTFAPFKEMVELLYLNLQNNKISKLEPDTLSGLVLLQHLNISRNKIKDISENSMDDLLELTKLDASKNKLTYFPLKTFRRLSKLETLNLADNQLKTFTVDYSRDIWPLERLNIALNQLDCDCNLAWLRLPNNLPKLEQLQETRCASPQQYEGYPVMCFPAEMCADAMGIPASSLTLNNVTAMFCDKELEILRQARTTIETTMEETTTEEITEPTTEITTEQTTMREPTTEEMTTYEMTTTEPTEMTTEPREQTTEEMTTYEMTTTEPTEMTTEPRAQTTESEMTSESMTTAMHHVELTHSSMSWSSVDTFNKLTTELRSKLQSPTTTLKHTEVVTETVAEQNFSTQSTITTAQDITSKQIMVATESIKDMHTAKMTTQSIVRSGGTLQPEMTELATETTPDHTGIVTRAPDQITTEDASGSGAENINHTRTRVSTPSLINQTEHSIATNTPAVTRGVTSTEGLTQMGDTLSSRVIIVTAKHDVSPETLGFTTASLPGKETAQAENQNTLQSHGMTTAAGVHGGQTGVPTTIDYTSSQETKTTGVVVDDSAQVGNIPGSGGESGKTGRTTPIITSTKAIPRTQTGVSGMSGGVTGTKVTQQPHLTTQATSLRTVTEVSDVKTPLRTSAETLTTTAETLTTQKESGRPIAPTYEIVDIFTTTLSPIVNTTTSTQPRSTRMTTTIGTTAKVEGRQIAGFPVITNTTAMSVRFGFSGRIKILIPDIRFNEAGKVEEFQLLIGVWGPFAVQIWREAGPVQDVMGEFNTTGTKVIIKKYRLVYSYNVAPTVGGTTINMSSLCVSARRGDYIGIMFPDTIVPVTYKFMKDNPTPLAFTTLEMGSPVPPIGSLMDFEVMMFPWHFNLMAVYDITQKC